MCKKRQASSVCFYSCKKGSHQQENIMMILLEVVYEKIEIAENYNYVGIMSHEEFT